MLSKQVPSDDTLVPTLGARTLADSFRNNNDYPPASILREVKALVSGPLQKLKETEKELQNIEQLSKTLEDECEALRKLTSGYDRIRAPIRRLPTDLLDEIFYHCLPAHRNPVMNCEEAPLLLTTICHSWRSAALSSPRLWARLHIPANILVKGSSYGWHTNAWDGTNQISVSVLEKMREDALKIMQFRTQLVETWLARSGSCPLSISLFWEGYDGPAFPDDGLQDEPSSRVLDLLLSMSARIIELEVTMPYTVYRQSPLWNISPSRLPILRRLCVGLTGPKGLTGASDSAPIAIIKAPNLRSLSIAPPHMTFHPPIEMPPIENLTSLSMHLSTDMGTIVPVLRHCQRLRHCKLTISKRSLDVQPYDINVAISLPHLLSLSLSIDVATETTIRSFYKHLHTPHLTNFEYQQFREWSSVTPPDDQHSARSYPDILHLLERCQSLTKFSMNSIYLPPEDVPDIFRALSQVTHLRIGPTKLFRRHQPATSPFANSFWMSRNMYQHLDLGPLTLPHGTQNVGSRLQPNDAKGKTFGLDGGEVAPLLPKLEVLEDHAMPYKTTDVEAKAFILSRLGAAARESGVSQLKRVAMTFARKAQFDIVADIRRAAEEMGAEHPQLDILYDPATDLWLDPEMIDFYLPSYGIGQWEHGS